MIRSAAAGAAALRRPGTYPRRSVPGCRPSYFFCKFVDIFPLDGPTKVPVFKHCARAVSQSATIRGWLAPADDLQLAAGSLQEEALAGVMLQSIRSGAMAGANRRIASSLLRCRAHHKPLVPSAKSPACRGASKRGSFGGAAVAGAAGPLSHATVRPHVTEL